MLRSQKVQALHIPCVQHVETMCDISSLEIIEREYGPDHREVAITLINLGNAYGSLGDATKQRDLLERALNIKVNVSNLITLYLPEISFVIEEIFSNRCTFLNLFRNPTTQKISPH